MSTGLSPSAESAKLRDILSSVAKEMHVPLAAQQASRLVDYVALLQRWNRTYNLTAVRDPLAMMTQHIADCLSVVTPLRRELVHSPARRVLDVGSGAGLPGVVIAAMAPEIQVVCTDSVGKKAAFVSHVASALGLENLRSAHSRVEDLNERFDAVVSRAFASLSVFVTLTRHLLAPRGVWMAMKGKRPDDEIALLATSTCSCRVERLVVPGLNAERCLVWVRSADAAHGEESERTLSPA